MNKAKNLSKINGKKFLREAFSVEQEVLSVQLKLSSTSITHNGVLGDMTEFHFIEFLRRHLPNRYAVDNAFVIDSNGKTSDQIDIVVYDHQYTPFLLDQQKHRFVPAEAVYAIFEVKPTVNKRNLDYAADKASSVRKLHRTSIPIIHAGGEYPAKKLVPIISGIIAVNTQWANGFNNRAFKNSYEKLKGDRFIDCGLSLSSGCFDMFDGSLNVGTQNNSLAYFIFRLLQKLQSVGTVPAVDWNKYAEVIAR